MKYEGIVTIPSKISGIYKITNLINIKIGNICIILKRIY